MFFSLDADRSPAQRKRKYVLPADIESLFFKFPTRLNAHEQITSSLNDVNGIRRSIVGPA
jgi:hypothetical protein